MTKMETVEAAVFAAAVVRQVFDRMDRGHGAPSSQDMENFVEEAQCIASMTLDTVRTLEAS